MAKKKKKKSVDLPHEVITEILLKLPVKILLRCRCVCKSWRSLISHDSNFATSHFQLSASPTQKLLFLYYDEPKSLSIDFNASFYDDSTFASLNLRFLPPESGLRIGGSCRGFLLFHCHRCLYLWNPSTGIHKQIPNSPITIASDHPTSKLLSGFAYDPLTDDYLVVLGSYQYKNSPIDLEIFSLRDKEWEEIEFDSHLPYTNIANSAYSVDVGPIVGLFLNGSIHWLVFDYETRRKVIIAFDLKEMSLSEIALPDDFNEEFYSSFIYYDLIVFRGLVGAWIMENDEIKIWVMQDYGVHSSWTKTVHFDFKPAPEFKPLYFTNCGDIVGTVGDGGLVKFNHEGHLLEYHSHDDCYFFRRQMVVYTESLLSFPGGTEQA